MKLYSGSSSDFISDTVHNRIAERLKEAYFVNYRQQASPSEVNSWRNSLRAMSQVLESAGLRDNGVILEYELPMSSKRLDFMVTGRDDLLNDQAVIVELKQWETADEADGDHVVTFVGGVYAMSCIHPRRSGNIDPIFKTRTPPFTKETALWAYNPAHISITIHLFRTTRSAHQSSLP
jgi:hypothetical protein